jgi:hypothetical protein
MPSLIGAEHINPEDEKKRDIVLTFGAPSAIVIRINSKDKLGLQPSTATQDQLKAKLQGHIDTAAKFGINGDAYRDRQGLVLNGKCLYRDETRIRLNLLVTDLQAAGYQLVNASWFQKSAPAGKRAPDPTLNFTFSRHANDATPMTERIKKFFDDVYVDGFYLWANPKMTPEGDPYRLDSINGFAGRPPKDQTIRPGFQIRYGAPAQQGMSGYEIFDPTVDDDGGIEASAPQADAAVPSSQDWTDTLKVNLGDRLKTQRP